MIVHNPLGGFGNTEQEKSGVQLLGNYFFFEPMTHWLLRKPVVMVAEISVYRTEVECLKQV